MMMMMKGGGGGGGGGLCKIRKRGCSSSASSTSTSMLHHHNYRLKRAVTVRRKRGGSTTPVPTWKQTSSSSASIAAAAAAAAAPLPPHSPPSFRNHQPPPPLSARKLAATLWEINQIPSPSAPAAAPKRTNKRELRSRGRDRVPRSLHSGSLPPHLSDPSHSPPSQVSSSSFLLFSLPNQGWIDLWRVASSTAIAIAIAIAIGESPPPTPPPPPPFLTAIIDLLIQSPLLVIISWRTPTGSVNGGVRSRLKDLSNGLAASKELVKILNRFWGEEDQHSSCLSIISALHAELEQAHVQLDQLIREQRSDHKREVDYLMKRFAEEKAAWRCKDKERVRAAVETIAGDVEVEKKLRRRSESLNKKLGVELAEAKAALSKVVEELESEKKARRIMEEVCDELAQGIGDDKAKVEEMKRESEKVREEVEKEREMLQLADLLREERLQMKLSEAKYQFEEKNAAVDKLRDELQAYLKSERSKQNRGASQISSMAKGEFRSQLGKMAFTSKQIEEREDHGEVEDPEGIKEVEPKEEEEEEEEDDDSAESDLHSIELNMDSTSRNYRSNYNAGIAQEDPNRVSVEEENKVRKSTSEKTRRGSVSLERSISDGIEWFLNNKNLVVNWEDAKDQGRFAEIVKQNQGQEYDDHELQEHKSIKGLRDHAMSASQMASAQCLPSPTRQWGQPWPSRDAGNTGLERATAGRESSLKTRQLEAKGKVRSSRHSRK
ncbi:hypothetical protein Scep_027210 [Stephania cephalantha]|uniref:Uncharacterized protein n=1 Tax=Stephania cephalantha TaxID=152367 RepID=A0AAP0EAS7_9MAGN